MLIITIRIPYHVLFFHNGYKIYPYIREYGKEVFVMELSSFARIGKGTLTKAIGLQKNYVEVYSSRPDVLNECKSNCHGCTIYQKKKIFGLSGWMKKRTRFTVSAIPARPPCGNSPIPKKNAI